MALLWLDLETTGLSPTDDVVLEVAAIVTDDQLNELARFESVTDAAAEIPFGQLDPVVQNMHASSGLWMRSAAAGNPSPEQVDAELRKVVLGLLLPGNSPIVAENELARIQSVGGEALKNFEKSRPQLAGSTISFDREFMRYHLPRTLELLSHRNLDVSTLNEVARRWWPAVYEARRRADDAKKHRALYDIELSIAGLRHYLGSVFPALPVPNSVK